MKIQNNKLVLQAQRLTEHIEEMKTKEKKAQKVWKGDRHFGEKDRYYYCSDREIETVCSFKRKCGKKHKNSGRHNDIVI